jgi:hypothetical protein
MNMQLEILNYAVKLEEHHYEKYDIIDTIMRELLSKNIDALGQNETFKLLNTLQ